jgi:hypothetical protein
LQRGVRLNFRCEYDFEKYVTLRMLTLSRNNQYADLLPNRSLANEYSSTMAQLGLRQVNNTEGEPDVGSYSTDMGNVTYVCPGLHPNYGIPSGENAANHTPEFTASAATEEAHVLTLMTSKGMAATAWRVLSDEGFAKEVRDGWEKDLREKQ